MKVIERILKLNDAKSNSVLKNAFFSFFIKGLSILVNFLTIPLVLSFLNTTQYGIWLTLTAILSWFSLFDLGFGNGLRNHLTTAIAHNNFADGKVYVSTTYAALTIIFSFLLVVFLVINPYLDWTSIFNAPVEAESDLRGAVSYAISLLFVQFVLRLINTVLLSFQRAAFVDLINALVQTFILIGLFALKMFHFNTLSSLSLVYSIIPVLVLLVVSFTLFTKTYKGIQPSFSFVKFNSIKGLLNLGLNFFVIQVASLVIYASDNFIISQLFKPSDVTTYNIAFKYFSISNIFFTILLTPFWSMTTKAFAERDFLWIKQTMKKLMAFWLLLVLLIVIQLVFSRPLYKLWTHDSVSVPLNLSIIMALYYIIVTWGNLFSSFLNGVGKVRLQLYFATISMLTNVPLAIALVKIFNFGLIGIPIATIIITSIVNFVTYSQYKKITGLKASGIWDR